MTDSLCRKRKLADSFIPCVIDAVITDLVEILMIILFRFDGV